MVVPTRIEAFHFVLTVLLVWFTLPASLLYRLCMRCRKLHRKPEARLPHEVCERETLAVCACVACTDTRSRRSSRDIGAGRRDSGCPRLADPAR